MKYFANLYSKFTDTTQSCWNPAGCGNAKRQKGYGAPQVESNHWAFWSPTDLKSVLRTSEDQLRIKNGGRRKVMYINKTFFRFVPFLCSGVVLLH